MLECANGNFVEFSKGGCIDQGSVRVRCPQGKFPCNDLINKGREFSCWKDCSSHGGLKTCQGNICLYILRFVICKLKSNLKKIYFWEF